MLLTETADQKFLLRYVKDYCEALAENYRIYHKRTLQGNLSGNYPEYAREQLQAMEDGTANLMRFACRKVRSITKSFKKSTAMHQITTVPKQVTQIKVYTHS